MCLMRWEETGFYISAKSTKEALEICEGVKSFRDLQRCRHECTRIPSNDKEFNTEIPEQNRAEIKEFLASNGTLQRFFSINNETVEGSQANINYHIAVCGFSIGPPRFSWCQSKPYVSVLCGSLHVSFRSGKW